MKYTQAELEGMSDFELNKIASGHMGLIIDETQYTSYGDRDENIVLYDNGRDSVDFCNNWNDCGELIEDFGISLFYPRTGVEEWSAHVENEFTSTNENPKRAVTIVYILIKQDA